MLEEGLLQILGKVYQEKAFDFRGYKESTLKRRIGRRLSVTKADSYEQYAKVLDADPGEYARLVDYLTIKVTEFFRNPQAWQILQEEVLPQIIREKIADRQQAKDAKLALRIWCAGCASGEEVYSVAMLINELLAEQSVDFEVDIWGTDIDKSSLAAAQQAEYKPAAVKVIGDELRNRYFYDYGDRFKVNPSLRNNLHFTVHDLVLDNPLEQMDLIVCRNAAIYFTRPLQIKIFMDFYNSLNEKGYLFLGKAEGLVGPKREKFKVINKRWRFYQKNASAKN